MTQNDRPHGDLSTDDSSTNDSSTNDSSTTEQAADPREHGKFSINEDWAAVVVGLALLAAALTGLIPDGIIP